MSSNDDIARIIKQERTLTFEIFNESVAFAIGSAIRQRAIQEGLPIIVQVSLWDRLLFYSAAPGSTHSNFDWARRKLNVVRMFQMSTYRLVLEQDRPDRTFKPGYALPPHDFILAGGGFPLTVKGLGAIGACCVSGLAERDDHSVIVDALCDHLGVARESLGLPKVVG